jgi:hypothetical protein
MIQLHDKDTGDLLGNISEDELRFLVDEFEEESEDDQDYYIDRATLEMLKEDNSPPALLELLTRSLGTRESIEIRWSRS